MLRNDKGGGTDVESEKSRATAFLFCDCDRDLVCIVKNAKADVACGGRDELPCTDDIETEAVECISTRIPIPQPQRCPAGVDLPPIDLRTVVAMMLPTAAVITQLGCPMVPADGGALVMGACLPLTVPFAVPLVADDEWMGSKRASAFLRACTYSVYLQGAFGVLKLVRGDLIGGLYDTVQAGVGNYALSGEGITLLPTFVVAAGFTGTVGLCKTYWLLHTIPLRYMPVLPYLPSGSSVVAAYFGYKLCKEVRAIAMGYPACGAEDSCFIHALSGDWWPANVLGSGLHTPSRPVGGPNFRTFAGSGNRLGSTS